MPRQNGATYGGAATGETRPTPRPLNLTPAEAGALARRAFGLAGHEDATPDEFGSRAAELAEAIDQADDDTRREFTRALLYAASAEWCKSNTGGKAVTDTAARAAACFRKADQGRERAQAAARKAGQTLAAGVAGGN